ncbi:MAG TPA: hypothetical protein VGG45_10940 [Terracidiphilus sp.]|jgi:methionine synthase II (cobalamin-independent)
MQAHLVGSIALPTVENVFSTVGPMLGSYLRRIPDGEPGGRRVWVNWQYPVFLASPYLRLGDEADRANRGARILRLRLADGVQPDDIRFGELGYAREARASYLDFCQARTKGEVPKGIRFQVCLPTPINIVATACAPDVVLQVEPAYEAALRAEIDRLCSAIPHNDLCIQWDMVREVLWWDGRVLERQPAPFPTAEVRAQVLDRLARLSAAVPRDVELGFHLCYGDWGGRHQIEPADSGAMVNLSNAIAAQNGKNLSYVHMPVPIARNDPAYFEPLRGLNLASNTEVYLGLVHLQDGVAGARSRIAAAAKFLHEFGVGTECGLGRAKTSEMVVDILALYAAICHL